MKFPNEFANGVSTFFVVLTAGFVVGLLGYVLWALLKGAVIE